MGGLFAGGAPEDAGHAVDVFERAAGLLGPHPGSRGGAPARRGPARPGVAAERDAGARGARPGSRATVVEGGDDGTTCLYTGDLSTRDRFTLDGFDPAAVAAERDVDALVVETTFDAARDGSDVTLGAGDAVVLPAQTNGPSFVDHVADRTGAIRAGVSGRAVDESFRYRGGYDEAFVPSDHCDFPELVDAVGTVDPARVYTQHGFADGFATHVGTELGVGARARTEPDVARRRPTPKGASARSVRRSCRSRRRPPRVGGLGAPKIVTPSVVRAGFRPTDPRFPVSKLISVF